MEWYSTEPQQEIALTNSTIGARKMGRIARKQGTIRVHARPHPSKAAVTRLPAASQTLVLTIISNVITRRRRITLKAILTDD